MASGPRNQVWFVGRNVVDKTDDHVGIAGYCDMTASCSLATRSNRAAVRELVAQKLTEGKAYCRTNRDEYQITLMDTPKNLKCHMASAISESNIPAPGCHIVVNGYQSEASGCQSDASGCQSGTNDRQSDATGEQDNANNIFYNDISLQYCGSSECEYKLHDNDNIDSQDISSYTDLTPSLLKVKTHRERAKSLDKPKCPDFLSMHKFCRSSENTRSHRLLGINCKRSLFILVLQTCLFYAVGKSIAVVPTEAYKPCLLARSSASVFYERHPTNCSVFYMCHGSKSWPLTCSTDNTVFSVKHKVCVWRHSDFDDCLVSFTKDQNSFLKESHTSPLIDSNAINGVRKSDNGPTISKKTQYSNNVGNELQVKQSVKGFVDGTYSFSPAVNDTDHTATHTNRSSDLINENRVNDKLHTKAITPGPNHDYLVFTTNSRTDKSQNADTEVTMKETAKNADEKLILFNSEETVNTGQDNNDDSYFLREENNLQNPSEKQESIEENNTRAMFRQGSNADNKSRTVHSFHDNHQTKTTAKTFVTAKRMDANKRVSFDYGYNIYPSEESSPFRRERPERVLGTRTEWDPTEPLTSDGHMDRANEHVTERVYLRQMTPIIIDQSTHKTKISSGLYIFTETLKEVNSFDKYKDKKEQTFLTEGYKKDTIQSSENSKETTTPRSSSDGGHKDTRIPLALLDKHVDRPMEDVESPTRSDEEDGYPSWDRDSSDNRQEAGNKRSMKPINNNKNVHRTRWYDSSKETGVLENGITGETAPDASSEDVQREIMGLSHEATGSSRVRNNRILLTKDRHVQESSGRNSEVTLSKTHGPRDSANLGKSWIQRQHKRYFEQTPPNSRDRTELPRMIPEDRQSINTFYDKEKYSTDLPNPNEYAENKYFHKEIAKNTNEKHIENEAINRFGKVSKRVLKPKINPLVERNENIDQPQEVPSLRSYRDGQQTRKRDDGRSHLEWYNRDRNVNTQTPDNVYKVLTPGRTQSTREKGVNNFQPSKSRLLVQPWPQLIQKLHSKQADQHTTNNNLSRMGTFLQSLNSTGTHIDQQVNDVRSTNKERPRLSRHDQQMTSRVWTTESLVEIVTRMTTPAPLWKRSDNVPIVLDHKQRSGLNPEFKHDGKESTNDDKESTNNDKESTSNGDEQPGKIYDDGAEDQYLHSQNRQIGKHQSQLQQQNQQNKLHHKQIHNEILDQTLRNDARVQQRKVKAWQNSHPQFSQTKVERPWFEKLLNEDKVDIEKKAHFDHPRDSNVHDVTQLKKVKQSNIRNTKQRHNYKHSTRKQSNHRLDPDTIADREETKMKGGINRGWKSKYHLGEDIPDNDWKTNVRMLQNENLEEHKQLLFDIRDKTSQKLLKLRMELISKLYTENNVDNELPDYIDEDLFLKVQPAPIDSLPQTARPSTAATTTAPTTTTIETSTTTTTTTTTAPTTRVPGTSTANTTTTTNRSKWRQPRPSYKADYVPAYRKKLKERCGVMATPLIIGGQRSRRGQWPWQVSLQIVSSTTPWHRCGGVLVHPRWVLTAAHCMEGPFYGDISNWRVVMSDNDLETVSGSEVYRNIARVISHPEYVRTNNFPNDVALLELDVPVDMTSGEVQTACMPDSDFTLVPGMKCWISGWGETRGTGGRENIMNEVAVEVLPHDQCKSMWGRVNIDVLDSQVCLGYGQTGACYGDSGGPLMCETDGRFYVAGVMSWLINNCSANNFPNVFTRLPHYKDWVYQQLDYFEWMRYL